ncbi:hypothetical protein [Noviherbaspirillum aerium]|uniref:hypothetical protein n=1 Tax=Noviherbaspirillum aerium TaxID=2588497 RepID=UPI00124ECAD3|nr:hypothetical protein [Noviherbaspirillum aerium]
MRSFLLMLAACVLPVTAAFGGSPGQAGGPQYHLHNGKLSSRDFPYIFDGKQIRIVKIREIRDADTEANRAACAKEWRRIPAYRQLCLNLSDHRILDVQLVEFPVPLTVQVPVIRIAKVDVGQSALVKMPEITPAEGVKSLPAFVGMLSASHLRHAL